MEHAEITIIGAGIVGLSVSYQLSKSKKNILVLEKHPFFGQETSSRNSEVIHAGIYYRPGSLKAEMCIKGKTLLYDFCKEYHVPHKNLGKLLIGNDADEIKRIHATYENAKKCGVQDLTILTKSDVAKLEPDIKAQEAIYSPSTGILDTHQVMKTFQDVSETNGVNITYGVEVISIKKIKSGYILTVQEPDKTTFEFESDIVINCAGFDSDKIAEMVGIPVDQHDYRIYYCKGQYFRIANPKKYNITRLIYPPPSPTDLGIHITPDLAGGLRLGPDAEYIDQIDYKVDDTAKEKFFVSVNKYLPSLTMDELVADTAGIRPKLQKADDAFKDFVIEEETSKGFPGFINLIGIESPGVTSCLAIAEKISKLIQ